MKLLAYKLSLNFAPEKPYKQQQSLPEEEKSAFVAIPCPLQPSDRQHIFSLRLMYKLAMLFTLSTHYKNLYFMNLKASFWTTLPPGPVTDFVHLILSGLLNLQHTHIHTHSHGKKSYTVLPLGEKKKEKQENQYSVLAVVTLEVAW